MKTKCKPEQLEFHALGRRGVVGRFDGGRITTDGGGGWSAGFRAPAAASGLELYVQTAIVDGAAVAGASLSNAVKGLFP